MKTLGGAWFHIGACWWDRGSKRFAPDFAPQPLRYAGPRLGLAQWAVSGRLWGMSLDTELQKHYALLLGVGSPWEVKTTDLKLGAKQVAIELGWQ